MREEDIPAAFYYQNKDGFKFFVFAFDAYLNGEGMNRSYARSRQISDAVKQMTGKALPAYCYGNPDLYILTEKNENSMAVGLFNLFADSVLSPVVELDGKYSKISFINSNGRLEGDKVVMTDIPPFGFAGFEVSE